MVNRKRPSEQGAATPKSARGRTRPSSASRTQPRRQTADVDRADDLVSTGGAGTGLARLPTLELDEDEVASNITFDSQHKAHIHASPLMFRNPLLIKPPPLFQRILRRIRRSPVTMWGIIAAVVLLVACYLFAGGLSRRLQGSDWATATTDVTESIATSNAFSTEEKRQVTDTLDRITAMHAILEHKVAEYRVLVQRANETLSELRRVHDEMVDRAKAEFASVRNEAASLLDRATAGKTMLDSLNATVSLFEERMSAIETLTTESRDAAVTAQSRIDALDGAVGALTAKLPPLEERAGKLEHTVQQGINTQVNLTYVVEELYPLLTPKFQDLIDHHHDSHTAAADADAAATVQMSSFNASVSARLQELSDVLAVFNETTEQAISMSGLSLSYVQALLRSLGSRVPEASDSQHPRSAFKDAFLKPTYLRPHHLRGSTDNTTASNAIDFDVDLSWVVDVNGTLLLRLLASYAALQQRPFGVASLTNTPRALIRHVYPNGTSFDGYLSELAHADQLNQVARLGDVLDIANQVIALYAADGVGQPDFALGSAGACPIEAATSSTWEPQGSGITGRSLTAEALSLLLGVPSTAVAQLLAQSSRAAIDPDLTVGRCWPLKGGNGTFTVRLATPAYVTAITVDHASSLNHIPLHPAGLSAPRHFTVYGFDETSSAAPANLGSFMYDIAGPQIQTFDLGAIAAKAQRYSAVKLHVRDNHGHPEFTCLYRFRVHGSVRPLVSDSGG